MVRPLRIALQKYRRVKISGGLVSRCLPGYLKIQSRDDFLRHNVVLAYMGGDDKKGRLRYRDFVLRGLTKKLVNPMEEVKAGAILGSDSFVVWVKEQFSGYRFEYLL